MEELGRGSWISQQAIVVSSADAKYFGLLHDLVSSLQRLVPDMPIAVFDLGLLPAQVAWLKSHDVTCLQPRLHCELGAGFDQPSSLGTLVKAFLHEYLPGHEFYIWLDADTWVQQESVLHQLVEGAAATGMAVVHENEPAYRFQLVLAGWVWKRAAQAYGLRSAIRQRLNPQINSGVYCIRRGAAQWGLFAQRFEDAIRRTGTIWPYDQFALNEAIYRDGAEAIVLDAQNNWICDRALPAWDAEKQLYVTPRAPHRPIAVMHLAGPAKASAFDIPVLGGGSVRRWLTSSGLPALERPWSDPMPVGKDVCQPALQAFD